MSRSQRKIIDSAFWNVFQQTFLFMMETLPYKRINTWIMVIQSWVNRTPFFMKSSVCPCSEYKVCLTLNNLYDLTCMIQLV